MRMICLFKSWKKKKKEKVEVNQLEQLGLDINYLLKEYRGCIKTAKEEEKMAKTNLTNAQLGLLTDRVFSEIKPLVDKKVEEKLPSILNEIKDSKEYKEAVSLMKERGELDKEIHKLNDRVYALRNSLKNLSQGEFSFMYHSVSNINVETFDNYIMNNAKQKVGNFGLPHKTRIEQDIIIENIDNGLEGIVGKLVKRYTDSLNENTGS